MKIKKTTLEDLTESDLPVLHNIIRSAGREKLRKKLKVIALNYSKSLNEPVKKKNDLKNIKEQIEELFNHYFSPYENLLTVRSDSPKDKLVQEAMSHYSIKNYEEASDLLKLHLDKYPGDQLLSLYLGISFLVLGKSKDASDIFKKILNSKQSVLYDQAKWYLALTKLKDSKLDESVNELSDIGKKSNYSKKSGNLIKKISLLK